MSFESSFGEMLKGSHPGMEGRNEWLMGLEAEMDNYLRAEEFILYIGR